jgi:tetratricopeptide (TPR) repeat protein
MTASAVTAPAAQSASPVKTKSPAEIQEDANSLLATGKRHLLVGDVPAAVSCLARCCELLSAQFGETAKECAESYFYYGKSLLELSRMESGVLGNALEGVPEDSDEKVDTSQVEDPEKLTKDEKSEVEDKVAEAFDYNYKTSEIIQDEEEAAMDGAETETDGSGMEDEELQEEDMETDDSPVKKMSPKAKQDSEKKGTEDEEEPSNLQLAWEVLELAKVVYTKLIATEIKDKDFFEERLCSTMLHLGEVSIENENYQQAVEDIKLCLTKQEKMPKDARLRAEIHYHLGLAQAFHQQFDESIESHKAAIAILKERTKNLKVMETSSTSPRKLAETNKEIAELEALIPEIEEKIVDTKDMKKEASKQKDKSGEKGDVFGSSSTDKSTASIAIKRRSSGSESASKKTAAAV